jgi:hypothetical protein
VSVVNSTLLSEPPSGDGNNGTPPGNGTTNGTTPTNLVVDANADDTDTNQDPAAAADTSEDDKTKSSPVGTIMGVGAFVIIALLLLLLYTRKQKSTLLDQIRAAAPPLANAVNNPAFADPNQQLPYGGDEVGVPSIPARADAGANVQPVQSMYEEADVKRAPIYDQGRLAGAASHALRDQRRASQLVGAAPPLPENEGYEEIAEGTGGTPAARGKRRNTVPASEWCQRAAPAGGTCRNAKVSGKKYCISHLCEQPGCTQSKSSSVPACPAHLQKTGDDFDDDNELDC